jgi:hypothetical protein
LLGGKAQAVEWYNVFMGDKPLLPGQWIDDLPEPLETVEDVEELFRMVEEKKAKRRAEASAEQA